MAIVTEKTKIKNRREFIRIPTNCPVSAQKILFSAKGDTELWGEAKNIGAGGILFTTDNLCQRDDMFKVTISLAGWKKHHPQYIRVYEDDVSTPVTVICQVLRSAKTADGKYEVAARFVNIYEDDMAGLANFIEYEAERLGVSE